MDKKRTHWAVMNFITFIFLHSQYFRKGIQLYWITLKSMQSLLHTTKKLTFCIATGAGTLHFSLSIKYGLAKCLHILYDNECRKTE